MMYRFQIRIFVYSRVHPYSFRPISNATKAKRGNMKAFIQLIYSIPSIRVSGPLFLFSARYHSLARSLAVARGTYCFPKYSNLFAVSIVSFPSSQPAGQTSPCSSVNWNALITLSDSSTDRPTGRSWMCEALRIPLGSMKNDPRREMPSSSRWTP
jgi:hypothetical protein